MTMRMSVPMEDESIGWKWLSIRQFFHGWLRLFQIEFWRSPGAFGAIVIGVLTAISMQAWLADGVVRWRDVNEAVGVLLVPVSAIASGIAAFAAQRDLTRGIVDQVTSTTYGIGPRRLAAFLPVALWAMTGNLIVVMSYFAYAGWRATWGGPIWGLVVVTQAAILVGSALGWTIGTVAPHRLAPITAIILSLMAHAGYVLAMVAGGNLKRDAWGVWTIESSDVGWRPLFPVEQRVFVQDAEFVIAQAIWLIVLAVVLWCLSIVWMRRTALTLVVMLGSLGLCVLAAANVSTSAEVKPAHANVTPMPFVCDDRVEGRITVCVYQEDAALLSESADAIVELLGPVIDIPGIPKRFEQRSLMMLPHDAGDTASKVSFQIWDLKDIRDYSFQRSLLYAMLPNSDADVPLTIGVPEYVVTSWLLVEAGESREVLLSASSGLIPIPVLESVEQMRTLGVTDINDQRLQATLEHSETFEAEVLAALDRFFAMPDDERTAWLEAHWDDLVHGRLTLENLP